MKEGGVIILKKLPIKYKVIAALLVLSLLPIIVVGYFQINMTQEQLRESFIQKSNSKIQTLEKTIVTFFESVKKDAQMLATHPQIKQAEGQLTTYKNTSATEKLKLTPLENGGLEADIYNIYRNYAGAHPQADYVYLATKDGGYLQWPATSVPRSYDPTQRPYYRKAMENEGKIIRTDPYYWTQGQKKLMSVVTTVQDDQDNIIGIQGINLGLNKITQIVKDIKLGSDGYIIATTKSGIILAHPQNEELNFQNISNINDQKLQPVLNGEAGDFEVRLNGKEKIVNYRTSSQLGWKFIAVRDKAALLSDLNLVYKDLFIIFLCTIAGVILVSIFVSKRVTQLLFEIRDFAISIADGDLTADDLQVWLEDEVGELVGAINHMKNRLLGNVQTLKETTNDLADYSEQLASGVQEGGERITATHDLVEDMSASIEEISAGAEEVTSFAQESSSRTEVGKENIEKTLASMNEISDSVAEAVDVISGLEDTSQEIGEIVEMINNIAEQTNLLALNAAIEAARAGEGSGEAGQGFAVVAEEIRELAGRTNTATEEVAELIAEIRSKTNAGLEAVHEVEAKVDTGQEIVTETGDVFADIQESSEETAAQIEQTAEATQELAEDSEQVKEATEDITQMAEETARSADELADLSERLEDLVDEFQV